MSENNALFAPVRGAEHRDLPGVQIDMTAVGTGRVRRVVYQPGFRWSTHMKGNVNTPLCMHAHVGFIVSGEIGIEYGDGCTLRFVAPQAVAIEPGHDGWVVGDAPAVLIEVDFEGKTASQFGMPAVHSHRKNTEGAQ